MLSMRSQETVNTLDEIEQQLLAMKVKSDEADTMFSSPPPEGLPSSMRNTLAQLHGDANRCSVSILWFSCVRNLW